jgi:hypothetical protein
LNKLKVSAQPVRGDILGKALEDLDLWGEQFSIAIIKILQTNGLVFNAYHYYQLGVISRQLRRLFGRETSSRMMELIKIGIQVQYFSC